MWRIHIIEKYIISRWNFLWMPFEVYYAHVFNNSFGRVCLRHQIYVVSLGMRSQGYSNGEKRIWDTYIRITPKSWDTWTECSLYQLGRFACNKNLHPLIQSLPLTWNLFWKDLEPRTALKFAPTLPLESTTFTQLTEVLTNSYRILV